MLKRGRPQAKLDGPLWWEYGRPDAKIWTGKSAREVSDKKDSVGRWAGGHLWYILAKNVPCSAYGLKVLRETEFKSNGLFICGGNPT